MIESKNEAKSEILKRIKQISRNVSPEIFWIPKTTIKIKWNPSIDRSEIYIIFLNLQHQKI